MMEDGKPLNRVVYLILGLGLLPLLYHSWGWSASRFPADDAPLSAVLAYLPPTLYLYFIAYAVLFCGKGALNGEIDFNVREDLVGGSVFGLAWGLIVGVVWSLGVGLSVGLVRSLLIGLIISLVEAVVIGLAVGLGVGLGAGLGAGLVVGLVWAVTVGLSPLTQTIISANPLIWSLAGAVVFMTLSGLAWGFAVGIYGRIKQQGVNDDER